MKEVFSEEDFTNEGSEDMYKLFEELEEMIESDKTPFYQKIQDRK